MSFSEDAWARAAPLYRAIIEHPFNAELAAGTLSMERFRHYMLQDGVYLIAYSRALSIAAARARDTADIVVFAESAREAVVVERALHESYFAAFGIAADEVLATEPSPSALSYNNFLIATAYHAPYEVTVGAVLPCFWIYWEVGRDIHGRAGPDNPFQAWIDTYADAAYGGGGAAGDRHRRPHRRRGEPGGARRHARGVPARRAARMDVLGRRLQARGLADRVRPPSR